MIIFIWGSILFPCATMPSVWGFVQCLLDLLRTKSWCTEQKKCRARCAERTGHPSWNEAKAACLSCFQKIFPVSTKEWGQSWSMDHWSHQCCFMFVQFLAWLGLDLPRHLLGVAQKWARSVMFGGKAGLKWQGLFCASWPWHRGQP